MSELRAGAAKSVITPTIGRWQHSDVNDELYAKALVLENGEVSLALVVCDVGSIARRDAETAREIAAQITGIPADHIMIAATHTHYGPWGGDESEEGRTYWDWAAPRIADAVMLAKRRLQPAKIAHGSGAVPGEVYNRRYRMKDGSVVFNPLNVRYFKDDGSFTQLYQRSDIVGPAGPTDPEVGVLIVMDEDGKPIAIWANYALHYVDSPDYDRISANYFGEFERALQRMEGREFLGVMMNGTCGDVNNVDYMGDPEPEHPYGRWNLERVSTLVAAEVCKVWRSIRRSHYQDKPTLAVATERIIAKHRAITPAEVEQAKSFLKEEHPSGFGTKEWLEDVKCHTILDVAKKGPEREMLIQAFRIGDLAAVALPGEVFVEIGLEIKRRSPFARTLVGELANDSVGYIPTDKAFGEGSYETIQSPVAVGTASEMVESAVKLLKRLAP